MKLYLELELDDYDEFTRRMLFLINQGKSFDLPLDSLNGNIKVKQATLYDSLYGGLSMSVVSVKDYN